MSQVKQNDTVRVHYTGTLENGEVFDSSRERKPLEFTLGQGQLIPGFENGVIDMKINETKTVQIRAADAYGEHRAELIQEVPKNQLPPEIKPEVGLGLVSRTPDGCEMPLTVTEVRDESIMVDANHPLAVKDLTFEIELVEIK
ncbi:MAG: peptidylprolyl isomerase [Flavobacteriales bacterium]|nr:peptidylprolyl isomerase [Flavobacteriales bacterium]